MLRELALVAASRERNACELFHLGGVVFIYWVGRKVLMSFFIPTSEKKKDISIQHVCMYIYFLEGRDLIVLQSIFSGY